MSSYPRSSILPLLVILLTAMVMAARPLTAQALVPNAKVQVRQCPPRGVQGLCRRWHGAFQSIDGDSLTLRESSGVMNTVAWTPATRVRVSQGRRRFLAQGAAVGLVLGGVAGAAAAASCGDLSGECGIAVPIGAGFGLAVGSLIGIVARTDRWVRVERPGAPRGLSFVSINLTPPTRTTTAGIGLRYQF